MEPPSPSSSIQRTAFHVRHEWILMLAGLFLFAVFNIVTAPYSPTPWLDEVSYTDPAASLALEKTFTSTVWGTRGAPIWTGNVPLHQLALAGWFKLFGFSCRMTRGADVIYYTLAVLLICRMARKFDVIRTSNARWLLFWILLSGTGLVALYRNGRYDAIGCLLFVVWVYCSLHHRHHPWTLLGVGLATCLMPAASLALGPFLALSGLTALLLWRQKAFRVLIVTGIGGIGGILILQYVYQQLGVPHIFKEVMKSSGTGIQDFILAVLGNPSYLAPIAVGGLIVIARMQVDWRNARAKTAIALLALGLSVPIVMFLLGKYEIYYSWMAILPASLGAVMLLEYPSVWRSVRVMGVALLLVATLLGLPRRCSRIVEAWKLDEPGALSQFALKNVAASDMVYLDQNAIAPYYILRPVIRKGFWATPPANQAELSKVTVAFLREPGGEAHLHEIFGGSWKQVDSQKFGPEKENFFLDGPFQLAVYRKFQATDF